MSEGGPRKAFPSAEHARLAESSVDRSGEWKAIGPYLSERAWGTVREDYSAEGTPWRHFPYEHARSRAYRWSEDGLAGICDRGQRLCLALAFWNGRDSHVKERFFGLSNAEGNHGEDVKEYWWFLDGTPTASWLRWRYHYPQEEFPYDRLRAENARRGRGDREFELADTGVFDGGRYWRITADYAKASPYDVCLRVRIRNAGPEAATIHALPTLWFRNTWSWSEGSVRPEVRAGDAADRGVAHAFVEHADLGRWRLVAGPAPDGSPPALVFCDNETNVPRVFGAGPSVPFPKDGINDHVVSGAPTVNPGRRGTKMACWYRLPIEPGATVELMLRLSRTSDPPRSPDLGEDFQRTLADRERDADAFYAALRPKGATDDEANVMRQAFAGMVWSQQFYHYDVERWLDGDPAQPPPPAARSKGRNSGWRHLHAHDILAMPDTWEFPWYAAWDLAFHCVVLARIDPAAAKHQLLLLFREWYMHPNGHLPAYEWSFGDVNPPVHAWAALTVFRLDGGRDYEFLARAFLKLLLNFTWWVNRKDALGDNIFEGGFLGLDNVGPFDRSAMLPSGEVLEQSDGTAWMAKFCLNMLEMALRLAQKDRRYEDLALKFFEHFASIASAMDELWDDADGFYYDRIRLPDGTSCPVRARSAVGILPLFAAVELSPSLWDGLPDFQRRARWFLEHKPRLARFMGRLAEGDRPERISLVDGDRLRRVLGPVLDESEFLSPFGLRSLSRRHRDQPLTLDLPGLDARLDYEPAESTSALFGGNSNWRGPIWFPLNFLALESLRHLHAMLGDGYTVELPTGSGARAHLGAVADDLERRMLRLFLRDESGRRPCLGAHPLFRDDPAWREDVLFHEYFHGDTGEGLGASHQTGWTALAGAMISNRGFRTRTKPHRTRSR
jgi:hypothetical protein